MRGHSQTAAPPDRLPLYPAGYPGSEMCIRDRVFATGTPVSNSMTELYTIQRYLQHDRLQEMGMGHFDCWARRFGETTTALELAPEGTVSSIFSFIYKFRFAALYYSRASSYRLRMDSMTVCHDRSAA